VGSLGARVRRWLTGRHLPAAPVPFEVACLCGQIVRGFRQPTHQALPCPACARPVFVLPLSPLPAVRPLHEPARSHAGGAVGGPWRRAGPLAACLALTGAILLIASLVNRSPDAAMSQAGRGEVLALLERGEEALGGGKFAVAARELTAARQRLRLSPEALGRADRRRLEQASRQADLLRDLASDSLDDMLRQAVELHDLDDEEWQTAFRARYQGKAVVFDAEVGREAGGYALGYRVFARRRPARVDLSDLELLSGLPLDRPTRLLFGARLADIRAEAGGLWVVRFRRDSGVLITDAGAATALRLGLEPDPALRDVLRRQAEWLAQRP
jgi:hypothetical protein